MYIMLLWVVEFGVGVHIMVVLIVEGKGEQILILLQFLLLRDMINLSDVTFHLLIVVVLRLDITILIMFDTAHPLPVWCSRT